MGKHCLCWAACALALGFATTPARADTWACEVLLCLSNPQGPTAVSQCIPPISRLWRALAKGDPFPTCDMGGDKNSSAQHQYASTSFCPPQYLAWRPVSDGQMEQY